MVHALIYIYSILAFDGGSMYVTEKTFKISSMIITGALRNKTAFHSIQLSGVIANSVAKNGIYKMARCKAMLKVMAPTRKGLCHTGKMSKLSFSDSEFMALNISTVTRIDRLIVVAWRDMTLVNISHPISGKRLEHWWKCDNWKNVI